MSKHFPVYEYECNCGCGESNMSPSFLVKMDNARDIAGIPFPLSSGCRCPKHNADEGGKEDSAHIATETRSACAGDITCTSSRSRFIILAALIEAGFTRIGIGKIFIHVDDDQTKPAKVSWVY